VALNDLMERSSGNCIIGQPFDFLCPYLPLREELYLSEVHLQAFLRLRSAGPEIGVTATFETLLLKVLRTDVALAKFGQICPLNTH